MSSRPKLFLVAFKDSGGRAVLREAAAARYLGMSRTEFRALVFDGTIPHTFHRGGDQRIYLVRWLDAYLDTLEPRRTVEKRKMPFAKARQSSPKEECA